MPYIYLPPVDTTLERSICSRLFPNVERETGTPYFCYSAVLEVSTPSMVETFLNAAETLLTEDETLEAIAGKWACAVLAMMGETTTEQNARLCAIMTRHAAPGDIISVIEEAPRARLQASWGDVVLAVARPTHVVDALLRVAEDFSPADKTTLVQALASAGRVYADEMSVAIMHAVNGGIALTQQNVEDLAHALKDTQDWAEIEFMLGVEQLPADIRAILQSI